MHDGTQDPFPVNSYPRELEAYVRKLEEGGGLARVIEEGDRAVALRDLMEAERNVICEAEGAIFGNGSILRLRRALEELAEVRSRHETHGR